MDLKELKAALAAYYERNHQGQWLGDEQLIVPVPASVWNEMTHRNPTVISEIKKMNSSTALAVNYFQMFSELLDVRVDYEVDIAIPLILDEGKGHPAVIDAKFKKDDVIYYIESKFLEPYYSSTHEISPSYLVEKYYGNKETAEKWISLLKEIQIMIDKDKFKYLDINQMLKHLLAIYRTHPTGPVELRNLIWKPEESFYENISGKKNQSYLRKRSKTLTEEMAIAQTLMNKFVYDSLGWKDCAIHFEYYNNRLNSISGHPQFGVFEEKYLL